MDLNYNDLLIIECLLEEDIKSAKASLEEVRGLKIKELLRNRIKEREELRKKVEKTRRGLM